MHTHWTICTRARAGDERVAAAGIFWMHGQLSALLRGTTKWSTSAYWCVTHVLHVEHYRGFPSFCSIYLKSTIALLLSANIAHVHLSLCCKKKASKGISPSPLRARCHTVSQNDRDGSSVVMCRLKLNDWIWKRFPPTYSDVEMAGRDWLWWDREAEFTQHF